MNYCSACGARVEQQVPPGDNLTRHVCVACGTIHYQNPRIVAGLLVTAGEALLLCRRAIEPRQGYWTFPAGFMENGESLEEAARRECQEEAGAAVGSANLFATVSIPHINQVHMIYRGELTGGFSAGVESLEVMLFPIDRLPWGDLAFRSVERTLDCYTQDLRRGRFGLHDITLRPEDLIRA